ncbi:hypothetical protein THAOC_34987 [Thalassiosira oceanica]|uniref:Uncharacterized protein n=1 Tax=Thalassiosira oceanica TaxID=159749 RepID=K0R2K6_THAOC|nr:hypothetical protein THAOC_34987 [Thalassiosira oceanica]|eukprot:EJK46350.1 hypothetical protein THAOC_34987 [Thalassiosira oceanica]
MIFLRFDLCRSMKVELRGDHVREGTDHLHRTNRLVVYSIIGRRERPISMRVGNSRSRHSRRHRPGWPCLQAEGTLLWLKRLRLETDQM